MWICLPIVCLHKGNTHRYMRIRLLVVKTTVCSDHGSASLVLLLLLCASLNLIHTCSIFQKTLAPLSRLSAPFVFPPLCGIRERHTHKSTRSATKRARALELHNIAR